MPISPLVVEPMMLSFHVVMLSASLKRSSARPCASVSSDGCQRSVSGKYSRKRGVEVSTERSDVPDFVMTLTTAPEFFPYSAPKAPVLNTVDNVDWEVST